MSLIDQLKSDLNQALKSGEALKVETLRGLLASLHNREIELRGKGGELALPAGQAGSPARGLDEEEMITVLRKEAKKRKEANQIYAGAGRADLANKELKELTFIKAYLPLEMNPEEIEAIVKRVIEEGVTEFGRVMGAVVKETKGRAEPGTVKEIVERVLGE